MVLKTFESHVLSYLERIRLVRKNLDTKPGSVTRDVFIDPTSKELADLSSLLQSVNRLQSFNNATGRNLDRLASNFALVRNSGTQATGTAILTLNTINGNVVIASGDVVTARNGASFEIVATKVLTPSDQALLEATASRIRSQLDLIGITDSMAVEVQVVSNAVGETGNIGSFSLNSTSINGISNVTNINPFSNGTGTESDPDFRSRVLNSFGSNSAGTAAGYLNTIFLNGNVTNAVVIEPGDTLMTRDGTDISTDSSGNKVVTNDGTGGKVDIYVQGDILVSTSESFVFSDKSGSGDATDSSNDLVLGQRGLSTANSSSERRLTALSTATLPFQPVDSIVSVSGSISGPNFVEKFTDTDGVVRGNYELIKDTGAFAGSSFGFDSIHFISNSIDIEDEITIKGAFNTKDNLLFSGVSKISKVTQETFIPLEIARVSFSGSNSLSTKHKPVTGVERVVNKTTGERYVISNQNLNSDGLNTTGEFTISGSNLPSISDEIEVSYNWAKDFNSNIDYDSLEGLTGLNTSDAIDWSLSNSVFDEPSTVVLEIDGNISVDVEHDIFTVRSVDKVVTEFVNSVSLADGDLGLIVTNPIQNIVSVREVSTGNEIFYTDANDGTILGSTVTLSSDSVVTSIGVPLEVVYNREDLFSVIDGIGSFANKKIILVQGVASTGDEVLVSYVANVSTLLPSTEISDLPVVRDGYFFQTNSAVVTGNQPVTQIFSGGSFDKNIRFAPTNVRASITGVESGGKIVVRGTILNGVSDAIVTPLTSNSLTLDLTSAILFDLGATLVTGSEIVASIDRVEKVTIDNSGVVTSNVVFDLINYEIFNNQFDKKSIENNLLSSTKITLPSTQKNLENLITAGDKIRVSFRYTVENFSEELSFSGPGEIITENTFLFIDRVRNVSGFTNAAGALVGRITLLPFNQPGTGVAYTADYTYGAPVENERITISFLYNDLISDSTLSIEEKRPIVSDVLIKAAINVGVDIAISVIVNEGRENELTNIENSVNDDVASFVNSNGLGTIIDASDIVSRASQLPGVDSVTLTKFSTVGGSGVRSAIVLEKNEFFSANEITVTASTR